jgi:5-methylcytosine-specific restriction enzyme A
MRTERSEFDKKTRELAWNRCGGKCEICTQAFNGRRPDYHHLIPCALGGDNSLGNCRVICVKCHREITEMEDRPRITKAKRIYEEAANLRAPIKRKIPSRPFKVQRIKHRGKL